MTVVFGSFLVLATWAFLTLAVVALGLVPAVVASTARNRAQILRQAMWWGLLATVAGVLALSLLVPLASAAAGLIGLGTVLGMGVLGLFFLRRRRTSWIRPSYALGQMLLIGSVLIAVAYFAIAVLGPVTNYDSGLYHLGAIKYAAEFGTLPGVANLYFPFGYGTAQFPLAALLTNGPWGEHGFRLLNGLLLALAALDLILRMSAKRLSPGFYVLAAGILATFVPMVALSDYWVTSPSQDSAALILTVVASAYLADAIHGQKDWLAAAAVAVALGVALTLIRPTLGPYALVTVVVLTVLTLRRRPPAQKLLSVAGAVTVLGAGAVIASVLRDRLLSGWLQYPLSVGTFDVPWLAPEPIMVRSATLGYHRDPSTLWESVTGWTWVQPWLEARLTQWETYEILSLLIGAAVLTIVAVQRAPARHLLRSISLTLAPSVVAVVVWWVATPPSFRFAWGPLFTLGTVPIGWAIWSLVRRYCGGNSGHRISSMWFILLGAPIVAVTLFSFATRLDLASMTTTKFFTLGVSIPYAITPIEPTQVQMFVTESGLQLLQPVPTDQCWNAYPLCTPEPAANLRYVDQEFQSGLRR